MKYTLVLGVDDRHLNQLKTVWPTWCRHKQLHEQDLVIFYDRDGALESRAIYQSLDPVPRGTVSFVPWPCKIGTEFAGTNIDKWTNPQRYKMLAGFVHVPADFVETEYWLKLDLDVVAQGMPDWIEKEWFTDRPAIVSHPWAFTKPPEQMVDLDELVKTNEEALPEFHGTSPLNLRPKPDADRVGHKRIISWCAFFNTEFTKTCSRMADRVCGSYQLPVPSQDGYLWYCAKRMDKTIHRIQMKTRGWEQWATQHNIQNAVARSLR